jgi:hypothetical protein
MATKVLELGLLVPQHVGKLEDPPEVRMADKIIEIAHGMMTLSMMLMSRLVQCCEMNTGGDSERRWKQLRVAVEGVKTSEN